MAKPRDYVWEMTFPNYVRNLAETLEGQGVAYKSYLDRHHLDLDFLRIPDGADAHQIYLNLISDILRSEKIDGLGLKTGQRLNLTDHGLLGYALNSCENLQKAIDVFCEYSPVSGGYRANFGQQGRDAYLDYTNLLLFVTERHVALRFQLEETFTTWLNIALKWKEPCLWFKEIHFEFSKPSYAHLYTDHFGCPILYDQPHSRFVFDKKYLIIPFEGYKEQVFNLTVAQCAELLKEVPQMENIADEIHVMLAQSAGRYPTLQDIAQRFHVSTATMRRRLAKEGLNYQQLLKNFRIQLACRYLKETQLSVNEIAYLTGYTDPANFNRAFRSVQKQSPQRYRKHVQNALVSAP